MHKRISNKTKDKLAIIGFLAFMFLIIAALSTLFVVLINTIAKADTVELTEQQQINRFYAEERIKAEMYYLAAWNTIERMPEEEYQNTFYKEAENV